MSDQFAKRALEFTSEEFLDEEPDYEAYHLEGAAEQDHNAGTDDDFDADEPYPCWEGETLHVPPQWRGELSEIEFSTRQQPEGTMVMVEIPGETTSVITALCTDGDGLMDICFGIDAAVSIASEPETVPPEFLVEHAMQLNVATVVFREAARRMNESMDEVFCPPDRVSEFKAQMGANLQGAKTLTAIADRVDAAIASVAPPLLVAAIKQSATLPRIH